MSLPMPPSTLRSLIPTQPMGMLERFRSAYLGAVLGDLIGIVWPHLEQHTLKGLATLPFPADQINAIRTSGWGQQNLTLCAALADGQAWASAPLGESNEPTSNLGNPSAFASELGRSLCCSLPLLLFFHDVPQPLHQLTALSHPWATQPNWQPAVQTYLHWVSDRLTQSLRQPAPNPHYFTPFSQKGRQSRHTAASVQDAADSSPTHPLIGIVSPALSLAPAALALVRSLQLYDQHCASAGAKHPDTDYHPDHYRTLGLTIGAIMGAAHGLSGWPIRWQFLLMQQLSPIVEAEWGRSPSAILSVVDQLAIAWAGGDSHAIPPDATLAIGTAQMLQPR